MLCNVWVVTYFGRPQRKSLLAWGITLQKARQVVDEADKWDSLPIYEPK